jgi:type IV pilus biogenesis protein CpaD/CtpE
MRGRNGGSNSSGCFEIPASISFNGESRQHSASIGAGVDPDAVGPLLDLRADRMTVDDEESMPGFVRKERLADPSKVRLTLLVEGNSRADARVDKQIVAKPAGVGKGTEERDMFIGYGLANCSERRFVGRSADRSRICPVTLKALRSAKSKPARQIFDLAGENSEQHFLVIAEKEDRLNVPMAIGSQPLDDLGRARSTIDEVAEEHQENLRRLVPLEVGVNVVEQALEQVETAVDVPDDIGAASLWTARAVG